MQDRYTCDVGDFGKYGLLRALTGNDARPKLHLGINWYRTRDESHNADGKHIRYLDESPENHRRFRACDDELYDALRVLVQKRRNVEDIRTASILPKRTIFHEPHLDLSQAQGRRDRSEIRAKWHAAALAVTKDCDMVFLDPDNGIASPNRSPISKNAEKHVFMSEIKGYTDRDQAMIIYHHVSRQGTAMEQAKHLRTRFANELGVKNIHTLYYGRGSARFFFVIPGQHQISMETSLSRVTDSTWGKHFSRMESEDGV